MADTAPVLQGSPRAFTPAPAPEPAPDPAPAAGPDPVTKNDAAPKNDSAARTGPATRTGPETRAGSAPPTGPMARTASEPRTGSETASVPAPAADPASVTRARQLLAVRPVADGHNGLPWTLRLRSGHDLTPGHYYDLDLADATLHTSFPALRAGGVGAQFWSVHVPPGAVGDRAVSATLDQIDFVHTLVRSYPESLRLALTADAIGDARNRGRIASLLGAASGHAIDSSLGTLRGLHGLGVRTMALTHDRNTPWADSALDEPRAGGLTLFGEEVIREMNRLGMLIDLSMSSIDVMRHTLALSKAPVLFSHSAAAALTGRPGDVPDDILERLPVNGGLCMVTFEPARMARGTGPATLADVADHLDHVREVAGASHVGLSGCYDGGPETEPATATDGTYEPLPRPRGLEDASRYPYLIAELLDRGWSETDIAKLTWENTLRVLRGAEFTARAGGPRRAPSMATIARLDGARR
ncbi:dipeptidase [Streptomyces varsoviensis]|nr:dipeptidase [Streptomyces varsoviensis]